MTCSDVFTVNARKKKVSPISESLKDTALTFSKSLTANETLDFSFNRVLLVSFVSSAPLRIPWDKSLLPRNFYSGSKRAMICQHHINTRNQIMLMKSI